MNSPVKIKRQGRVSLGRELLCRHMEKADINLDGADHAGLASNVINILLQTAHKVSCLSHSWKECGCTVSITKGF
jgi:hypothetical protein